MQGLGDKCENQSIKLAGEVERLNREFPTDPEVDQLQLQISDLKLAIQNFNSSDHVYDEMAEIRAKD